MSAVVAALRQPERLHRCDDASIPDEPGVYGWYFSDLDGVVPLEGCHEVGGRWLLYVGIAPSRTGSDATLRSRIRNHCGRDASRSTLRRSLGSLLADRLGLQMRRVGKSERRQFGKGEAALSEWMAEHARVSWVVVEEAWTVESAVIAELHPPLNLEHNADHPFAAELARRRAKQNDRARELAVLGVSAR